MLYELHHLDSLAVARGERLVNACLLACLLDWRDLGQVALASCQKGEGHVSDQDGGLAHPQAGPIHK